MNKQKWMLVALTASLALHCAFVGAWAYHVFYVRPGVIEQSTRQAGSAIGPTVSWAQWAAQNLSPDQRSRILAEHRVLRRELEGRAVRVRDAREKFFALLAEPQADREAVEAAAEGIALEEREMRRLATDNMLRVRSALTPQQRRELAQMLRQRWRSPMLPQRRMQPRPMGPPRTPEQTGPREPQPPRETRNPSL